MKPENKLDTSSPIPPSYFDNLENREILVPGLSPLATGIDALLQRLETAIRAPAEPAPYTVDTDTGTTSGEGGRGLHGKRPPSRADVEASFTRTTATHGLTGDEVKRLGNAAAFMVNTQRHRRQLWFATVGDRIFDDIAPGEARNIIADVQRRIGKLQTELGLPRYRITVFETIGGLHAHMLFHGNRKLVKRLMKSAALKPLVDVRWAYDVRGLSEAYLCKERTPQANHGLGHRLKGGRKKGSHRLPGGGDRVRLSGALKHDAIAAGYVEPWKQTNAKRAETRKQYRRRRLVPWKASRPVGQLPLFPEIERGPVRFRDYFGGHMPPSVAVEFEFHRRRHGWSQQKLGELAGLSQPTLANAIAGLYGLSREAVIRIKQVLAQVTERGGAV